MFYYIKKKVLSDGSIQYYLYKAYYVGNGRKKHASLGRCDEIEELLKTIKTTSVLNKRIELERSRRSLAGRAPDSYGHGFGAEVGDIRRSRVQIPAAA